MRVRLDKDWKGQVRAMPGMNRELHSQATEVKRRAVAIAPHGPTGMYRRSITVKSLGGGVPLVGRLAEIAGGTENPARYAVATTDFAGHMVEWGSKNNPPYAVLRRAARAAGLKLREVPKP